MFQERWNTGIWTAGLLLGSLTCYPLGDQRILTFTNSTFHPAGHIFSSVCWKKNFLGCQVSLQSFCLDTISFHARLFLPTALRSKAAKVMFSQACLILFTRGRVHPGCTPPLCCSMNAPPCCSMDSPPWMHPPTAAWMHPLDAPPCCMHFYSL